MNSAAANYMPKATFDDCSCAMVRTGCGHPMAYNYDPLVTEHTHLACSWYAPSPPSAPVMYPAGALTKVAYTATQESTYTESPESFLKTDAEGNSPLDYICAATKMAVDADSASCTVKAGSSIITIHLFFDSPAKSNAGVSTLNLNGTLPVSVLAVLKANGLSNPISSTAITTGSRNIVVTNWAIPPSPPPGTGGSAGIVIGIVIAVIVIIVLAGVGVYCLRKRRKTPAVQPGE